MPRLRKVEDLDTEGADSLMAVTIPRAEIQVIAERYGDKNITPSFDPSSSFIRQCAIDLARDADHLRRDDPARRKLIAEADDLDALADRYEKEAS